MKETFSAHGEFGDSGRKVYRAGIPDGREPHGLHWKPSIFCTRKASRITLEITAVRIERLNVISEADAKAEGVTLDFNPDDCPVSRRYIESYAMLWDSLNEKLGFGWSANPWVWVVEFRRIA